MRGLSLLLAAALACAAGPGAASPDLAARRSVAARFESHGLVEEAVAEYLKILSHDPNDADARQRTTALVERQMPRWLPPEAERVAPFTCEVLEWIAPRPPGVGADDLRVQRRALATRVEFPAREGERWDEAHQQGFPLVDYGYAWDPVRRRYQLRVAAHWEDPSQADLAQAALRATLALYLVGRDAAGIDPTKPWGDPVDVWIAGKGEPGARAAGRSIYLYAAGTPRSPGEWLRQIAHEYGHVSLPGIGGFNATDDPWADGYLGEVLFAWWVAQVGAPAWLPWPADKWHEAALAERERLMVPWPRERLARLRSGEEAPPEVLSGADMPALEAFLGLALRVEEIDGPRGLVEALERCRRGTAACFAASLRRR